MMKRATDEQLKVAKKYKIPRRQAHLINMAKVAQYEAYLDSQAGRDEDFLNSLREKTI